MSTNYFVGCGRCRRFVDLAVRYASGFVFGITSREKPDEVEARAGEFIMGHPHEALRIFSEDAREETEWTEIEDSEGIEPVENCPGARPEATT